MDDLISRQAAIDAFDSYILDETTDLNGNTVREVLEKMPSAQSEQRWIPVSERLPELNNDGASDPVLLCWADRQIVVGFYAGNGTFYAQSFPFATDGTARIIAWMPLPDPYKEEER